MNPEDYDPTKNNSAEREFHSEREPDFEEAASEPTPEQGFKDISSSFKDAVREGMDDAREAAQDTIPKVKEELGKGVHDIAYGLSYLVSFGSTLAREFAPENMNRGFEEGKSAGRKAAEDFAAKQRTSREEPVDVEPEMV